MKKMKQKDHIWRFVKCNGDVVIYARCGCGFKYSCCENIAEVGFKVAPAPNELYPYCPLCGSKKTKYIDETED